jgi:hypothetical protein
MANYNRARFANNNQLSDLPASRVTYSSQQTAFPYTNCQNDSRFLVWKPAGNFTITTANQKLHFSDGSVKTATVPVGDYLPATLATAIQTALNAVSSLWTCSYSTTTGKFNISHTGSVILKVNTATNAIWDTIGFSAGSDATGTSFDADRRRNHTHESVIWDFGGTAPGDFFAVIGQAAEVFTISDVATISLKANSVNNFTTPALEATLARTEDGIFAFNDADGAVSYRYWEFKFIDRENSVGATGFNISHIYLGDYDTLTTTNVTRGFQKSITDLSRIAVSDSGAKFAREKAKYWNFQGMEIQNMSEDERITYQNFFNLYGKHKPFYFSLDSSGVVSSSINELTKFVRFTSEPGFSHLVRDVYTMSFSLDEVI